MNMQQQRFTADVTIPAEFADARPLELLVVDDHGIVRDGLVVLLEREPRFKVVAAVGTGAEAIDYARRIKPQVIIMDLMLPDVNGMDATRTILDECPETRIVVLSASRSPEHLHGALRCGARGYVAKSGATTDLVRAVNAVMAGEYFVSPGIIPGAVDQKMVTAIPKGRYERLSKREREVLGLVASGSSSADIALRLSLSKKTIDTYRGRLMIKLGLRNRSELIRFALESQIVPT